MLKPLNKTDMRPRFNYYKENDEKRLQPFCSRISAAQSQCMKNQVNSSGFEMKSLSTKKCGLRQSTRLSKKAINAIITDEDYSDQQMKKHFGT